MTNECFSLLRFQPCSLHAESIKDCKFSCQVMASQIIDQKCCRFRGTLLLHECIHAAKALLAFHLSSSQLLLSFPLHLLIIPLRWREVIDAFEDNWRFFVKMSIFLFTLDHEQSKWFMNDITVILVEAIYIHNMATKNRSTYHRPTSSLFAKLHKFTSEWLIFLLLLFFFFFSLFRTDALNFFLLLMLSLFACQSFSLLNDYTKSQ